MNRRKQQGRIDVASVLMGMLLLIVVAFGARWLLSVGSSSLRWDEKYAIPILEHIVNDGWSVESVIDYDDTKGPAFFVAYAAVGEMLGVNPAALRLVSIGFFVLGGGLLVAGATLAGLSRRLSLVVAALYLTLPYGLLLGQLVMSEAEFVAGSVMTMLIFAWTVGTPEGRRHERLGIVLYAGVLVVLLHCRIHAVALGAAVCFGSIWVCGTRCLWWWAATAVAGLLRIPLMVRWGGLVGESFRDRYGLGFELDSLTYLAAALVPTIGVFFLHGLVEHGEARRSRLRWMATGGLVGIALAFTATPRFTSDPEDLRFAGIVATAFRRFADQPTVLAILMALPCAIGLASLTALGHLAWQTRHQRSFRDVVLGVGVWTIVAGWGLYALTRGDVYDRYLLGFSFGIPLVMMFRIPTWLVLLQLVFQGSLAVYQVMSSLGPS